MEGREGVEGVDDEVSISPPVGVPSNRRYRGKEKKEMFRHKSLDCSPRLTV